MRRYLLDAGIVSDLINRRCGVHEKAREMAVRGNRIGIPVPVLGELWAGVEYSSNAEPNRAKLRHGLRRMTLWPLTSEAAAEFGRIFAHLRRNGRPMQQIDVQVAAIARTLGNGTVVTKDSDFSAIPGLDVEDWSEE